MKPSDGSSLKPELPPLDQVFPPFCLSHHPEMSAAGPRRRRGTHIDSFAVERKPLRLGSNDILFYLVLASLANLGLGPEENTGRV